MAPGAVPGDRDSGGASFSDFDLPEHPAQNPATTTGTTTTRRRNHNRMKNILTLIAALLGLSATAQTNIYPSDAFVRNGSSQLICSGNPKYFYSGTANWHAPGMVSSNKFFYPTTNVLTIDLTTNHDARVQYLNQIGQSACANGSLTWTDAFWQSDIYVFTVYWSNNVAVPTNGTRLSLTTVNFRTNSP